MIALSFSSHSLPSGNEIFSLSHFMIPAGQSVPSFSLISRILFLANHFPRAYNPSQPNGLSKLRMLQFPNKR